MQIGHVILIFLLAIFYLHSSASATSRASFLFNNGGYGSNLIHLPSELPSFKEAPSFKNGQGCPPFHTQDTLCDPLSVHIVMTLDASYLRGTMAAILSIVQHASCPENVVFHFLASAMVSSLSDSIRSTFPYLRFDIHQFDEDLVMDRISSSVREALEQPLNYARIFIAEMLPTCVNRVIYLDSDVIVVDDIVKLWSTNLNGHTIGAPEYCHANFTTYFNDAFWNDRSLSMILDDAEREPCYFNTGVMVMDLHQWRQEAYTQRLLVWMDIQKEKRIYELGSLPPFLLVFGGNVEPIEHRWNQHGLGGDNKEGRCRSLHEGPVSLLHWSGKGKPWVRLDAQRACPLDSLWAPYDLATPFDGENIFVKDN